MGRFGAAASFVMRYKMPRGILLYFVTDGSICNVLVGGVLCEHFE